MVTVIADYRMSCIFCIVIGPLAKINFTIRYTHLYCHTTMDDNANKKKADKVDSSNDVDPDPEQEGELPHPFTMEDEWVKRWIHIILCLAYTTLHLDWCVCQISFIILAKPALVYTSIHSTVTARYSCGDLLRVDSTCGRSSSFVVRREWARRSWDWFSQ
jgi:hypothetical protein